MFMVDVGSVCLFKVWVLVGEVGEYGDVRIRFVVVCLSIWGE